MTRALLLLFASQLLLACGGQTSAANEPHASDAGADADASIPDATDADAPDQGDPTWDQVTACVESDPPMVLLPSGFCIDSTEVTRGQYRAWLNTNPALVNQHERCKYNASFVPDEPCEDHYPWDCSDDDCPQTCVDWCDAFAFCRGMGKRMCGKTSGGVIDGWSPGGPEETAPLTNPKVSQWYHACSSDGAYSFPYGDAFDKAACNTNGPSSPLTPVGSKTACQSPVAGYEGVFDLSGNLPEWEDNCVLITNSSPPNNYATDGRDDYCYTRGGGAWSTDSDASCTGLSLAFRADPKWTGVRCCWP